MLLIPAAASANAAMSLALTIFGWNTRSPIEWNPEIAKVDYDHPPDAPVWITRSDYGAPYGLVMNTTFGIRPTGNAEMLGYPKPK